MKLKSPESGDDANAIVGCRLIVLLNEATSPLPVVFAGTIASVAPSPTVGLDPWMGGDEARSSVALRLALTLNEMVSLLLVPDRESSIACSFRVTELKLLRLVTPIVLLP